MFRPTVSDLTFFIFSIILSMLTLLGNPLWAGERLDLEAVLDKVDKAGQGLTTMEADVIYTRIIFLLEEEETSNGRVKYKKPKRLHLKFEPPKDELDISDGDTLWVYRPEVKQVEKYYLAKEDTKELTFFEFGYEGSVKKAKENYHIHMTGYEEGDKGRYILKLTPRAMEPPPQYNEIRLWIEEALWLPVQIELYESQGEVINRIQLKDIKKNRTIPDETFRFTPPEGVEVVEPF